MYKKSDYDHARVMAGAPLEDAGEIRLENHITMDRTLTEEGEAEFREYIHKYEGYVDLIMKNTPEDEYPEELEELKFHKAMIHMVHVFGARKPLEVGQLAFLGNIRGYDGDTPTLREVGKSKEKGVSREVWRAAHEYYPFGGYRDAATALIDIVCDYGELAEKDSFKSTKRLDLDSYEQKLALDSLAVLGTYTGCQTVSAKILTQVSSRIYDKSGSRLELNIPDFYKSFGVKHSKELARKMMENNAQAGDRVNAAKDKNRVSVAPRGMAH